MIAYRLKWAVGGLFMAALAAHFLAAPDACAQDKDKLGLDMIPKKVMDALKAKFPKAEIHRWFKGRERDYFIYFIEFKQGKQKFEADIKENGAIDTWEKEIAAKDLPKAVRKALDKTYAKATLQVIMEYMKVKNGKDVLEGYEIVLETANRKEVLMTIAPDGDILEDSGAK